LFGEFKLNRTASFALNHCGPALHGPVQGDVVRRVAAAELEAAVIHQLRGLLRAPEIIIATWRAARLQDYGALRHRQPSQAQSA
jgi:hypothetical protein